MPESVQSRFELSIHLSVSEPAVNCSKNSSREKNTGKCMESRKPKTVIRPIRTHVYFILGNNSHA